MNAPSPFSPFLNTNYVPSDIEMGVIKSLVKGEEAEAAVLATQILEAKQALGALEERHAIHRKFIEDHTMLLSPIRRIPVDVLTLIFLTCRDTMRRPRYAGDYNRLGTSNRHVSVVISHVCTDWRRLALDTPSLWSQIHIEFPSLHDPCNNNAFAYADWCMRMSVLRSSVKVWISRASSSPLTLRLSSGSAETSVSPEYRVRAEGVYGAFVDILRGSCSQWQDIHCTVWADPMTSRLVKLFDGARTEYSILSKIYLYYTPPGREPS